MMKQLLLIFLLFTCVVAAEAQTSDLDSLAKAYRKNKQDTTLVQLLDDKAIETELQTNTDSGLLHTQQALAIARKIHYKKGEAQSLADMANFLNERGDLPGALKVTFEVLPLAAEIKEYTILGECYNTLGLTYSTLRNSAKALEYYKKGLALAMQHHTNLQIVIENNNISREFLDINQPDSALRYTNKAYALCLQKHLYTDIAFLIRNFGIIQYLKGNYALAINFFRKSAAEKHTASNHYLQGEDYRRMAEAYQKLNNLDSCIYCAKIAYQQAQLEQNPNLIMLTTALLTDVFKAKNDYKQAYEYQQIMLKAQDSLFSQQKTLQVQNLTFAEQQRQDELKAAAVAYQNRVRYYALLGVIAVFALIAAILLYANNRRKKANSVLQRTLSELKKTQRQLIQSEKMASLGELTAGIAHEIQNPLNFINNFSEVSVELLEELKAESQKPKAKRGEQLETELIEDLIENQQKINHHGKRADSIVKGMLQHSRAGSNQKELTDLNALTDEYLRLAYHGLRAKDKSFNAEMVTHFDEKLPKVEVVPQDIGRVLLNLFNNAFYVVSQKAKTEDPGFKPTVAVSTFTPPSGGWGVSVKDNGTGIPENIREKIMQPFFTTKPTGEGTGLGLSLSYDIVVKGHGGNIEVQSAEGKGSEFIIKLPLNNS